MVAFVFATIGGDATAQALSLNAQGGGNGAWFGKAICIATGLAAFIALHKHYTLRLPFIVEVREMALAVAGGVTVSAALAFALSVNLPRGQMLDVAILLPLVIMASRGLARVSLRATGRWALRVVVVGDHLGAKSAAALLSDCRYIGYEVVDVLSEQGVPAEAGRGGWANELKARQADLLIVATNARMQPDDALMAGICREGVAFAVLPQGSGLSVHGTTRIGTSPDDVLISIKDNLRNPVARSLKVGLDVSLAAAALIILAPVFLVISAVIKLDGGPVFFGHKRIGAGGHVFKCLKFRSMVVDSEVALQKLLARDPAAAKEWAATHKLRNDPRVTWIGRVLRQTSLDELPQLLNVLRLEMSLVGPRPIVSLEVHKYDEDIAHYYRTRPGITGLWQVSGRSETSYAQRVHLDSHYVRNWSNWQDISILFRTIPAVLSGRGAN